MARLRSRRSLPGFRWWRSLRRRLSRWLDGMAERCCRARRCGLVGRVWMRLRARAVAVIAIVVDGMSVADVGGIAGVDGMIRVDAEASVRMLLVRTRRGPMQCRRSFMQSRVG